MRYVALAVALVLTLPASAPARPTGGSLLAFVADTGAGRLVGVNVGSGRIGEARIPRTTASVVATPWPGRVLVVDADRVTLYEARSLRALHVFAGFSAPCDAALSASGRYAYVTDQARGELVVLDLRELGLIGRVAVRGRPCRLAVTDDEIWVAQRSSDSRLSVLDAHDAARPRPAGRVDAGAPVNRLTPAQRPSPGEVSVGRPRYLWISYRRSGVLGKLDTATRRLVFRKRIGVALSVLAVGPRELHAWVVDEAAGRLLVVDTGRGNVVRRIAVGRGVSGIGALVGRVVLVRRDGTIAAYYSSPDDWLGREWARWRLGTRLTAIALAFD